MSILRHYLRAVCFAIGLVCAGSTQADIPSVTIDASGSVPLDLEVLTLTGLASDSVGVTKVRVLVRNQTNLKYWSGSAWVSEWSWFQPDGTETWFTDVLYETPLVPTPYKVWV